MIWVFFIAIGVLLIGGFAALIAGRVGYDPLSEATTTQADPVLSEEFGPGEVAAVRFDTALRGYRMDQVDVVLDRLQARIAELEAGDRHLERGNHHLEAGDQHLEAGDQHR